MAHGAPCTLQGEDLGIPLLARDVSMERALKKSASCQCWPWIWIAFNVAHAIKFDVHETSRWTHETEADGEVVQMWVQVDKEASPGPSRHMGVDIVIQAPGGQYIHTEKMKLETIRDEKVGTRGHSVTTKYEAAIGFTAVEKGRYNICFHNRGNVVETVKLDIYHAGVDREEPVKDVHIRSLMEHMASLADTLVDVEFEQDWLASQTDRRASILSDLSKRVVYKAVLEAFALIACSVIQVVLLQRLFQKHLSGKKR